MEKNIDSKIVNTVQGRSGQWHHILVMKDGDTRLVSK